MLKLDIFPLFFCELKFLYTYKNQDSSIKTARFFFFLQCVIISLPHRYHSCYPWHNKGEYDRFMAPGDEKIKEAVLKFNRCDSYYDTRSYILDS